MKSKRNFEKSKKNQEILQLVIGHDPDFDHSLLLGHAGIGDGQGSDVSEGAQNHSLSLNFELAVKNIDLARIFLNFRWTCDLL